MMNLDRFIRPRYLLIGCLAAGFAGNFANAQVSQGKFNLPVETHWGNVVLLPGPYSFTLDHASSSSMITVRAHGRAAMIPTTAGISTGKTAIPSNLLLVTREGETRVSGLYLGHLGLTLQYRVAKVKTPVIAQVPEVTQHVLISDAEK
jgi:hypothetical protein